MANEYKLPFTGQEITEKLNRVNVWYATCTTPTETIQKVVVTNQGNFTLITGNICFVLFAEAACANATLNIDNTGEKTIYTNDTMQTVENQWGANEVIGFVYDGSSFRMIEGMKATESNYGMTKLSSSINSISTDLAATPSAVKAAYDLANSKAPRLYLRHNRSYSRYK